MCLFETIPLKQAPYVGSIPYYYCLSIRHTRPEGMHARDPFVVPLALPVAQSVHKTNARLGYLLPEVSPHREFNAAISK